MTKRTAVAVLLCFAAAAWGEDAAAKAAREELERQLRQMVGKQPTKVRVDYVGVDDPNYGLDEASFELDGKPLKTPPLAQLTDDGPQLVWNGDVTPGKHTVSVKLVVANNASIVLSDEGGYKWRLVGDVSFEVNAGIEVRVQITPVRVPKQADLAKRFRLTLPAQPVMIAQLDDGTMPEAMKKPVLSPVDAGPSPEQLAAEQKRAQPEAEAEAKRLAAEEKKQQAAAAVEAKRLAAEEKKQQALAAAEAKRAAAEEKKRLAAEAAEARRLAAAEKKQQALAALEAKRAAAEDARRAAAGLPPLAPPVLDSGFADAGADAGAAFDAGPPVLVAEAPADAGVAPPPAPEAPAEEGPPWLWIGLAGGLAALIFLVLVARRRSRPPRLDD